MSIKNKIREILLRVQKEAPKQDKLVNKVTYNANSIPKAVQELLDLYQAELERKQRVIKIAVGNIRAAWNRMNKVQIDTNNALTIGTITEFISTIGLKITELEQYLDQHTTEGGKE